MRCPNCHSDKHVVRETRDGIRRTRQCKECAHRFVTHEGLDTSNIMVRKRDGTTETFNRERLSSSIKKAAVRKLSTPQLQDIVHQVIERLFANEELFFGGPRNDHWLDQIEVSTQRIGQSIMEVLESKPVYRATRMRYALLFGRSNDDFFDAAGFLDWLGANHRLEDIQLPTEPQLVVKREGTTVAFERQRFYDSIKFAVKKRPMQEETRPGAKTDNEELIRTLYSLVIARVRGQRTVTSAQLALGTMWVLLHSKDRNLSDLISQGDRELADLRVASSAKHFTRIEDFQAEAALIASRSDRARSGTVESPPRQEGPRRAQ